MPSSAVDNDGELSTVASSLRCPRWQWNTPVVLGSLHVARHTAGSSCSLRPARIAIPSAHCWPTSMTPIFSSFSLLSMTRAYLKAPSAVSSASPRALPSHASEHDLMQRAWPLPVGSPLTSTMLLHPVTQLARHCPRALSLAADVLASRTCSPLAPSAPSPLPKSAAVKTAMTTSVPAKYAPSPKYSGLEDKAVSLSVPRCVPHGR
mmetsp:Transcript_16068/g.49948  ORF Transcript_16068/g.49948 Transcript_16068/m.49948 type:complete len:206 (+) Transcript_16068:57-674(+)